MTHVSTMFFWALLAAVVFWLWRSCSSRTARGVLLGALLVTVGSGIWTTLLTQNALTVQVSQVRVFKEGELCVGCRERTNPERYRLQARSLIGAYSIGLASELPYVLRFTGGAVGLDFTNQQLKPGCHSGLMPTSARLEFEGVRNLYLEIGSGAKC